MAAGSLSSVALLPLVVLSVVLLPLMVPSVALLPVVAPLSITAPSAQEEEPVMGGTGQLRAPDTGVCINKRSERSSRHRFVCERSSFD